MRSVTERRCEGIVLMVVDGQAKMYDIMGLRGGRGGGEIRHPKSISLIHINFFMKICS